MPFSRSKLRNPVTVAIDELVDADFRGTDGEGRLVLEGDDDRTARTGPDHLVAAYAVARADKADAPVHLTAHLVLDERHIPDDPIRGPRDGSGEDQRQEERDK